MNFVHLVLEELDERDPIAGPISGQTIKSLIRNAKKIWLELAKRRLSYNHQNSLEREYLPLCAADLRGTQKEAANRG